MKDRPSPTEQKKRAPSGDLIDASTPETLPRVEDDEITFKRSPEFHDRPDGATKQPPTR